MIAATSLSELFALLVGTSAKAALLVALVLGALYLARSPTAELRHSLWFAVSAGCVGLPLFSLMLPSLSVPLLPGDFAGSAGAGTSASVAAPGAIAAQQSFDFRAVLAVVYWCGICCVFARFLLAVSRLARLKQSARPAQDSRMLSMLTELAAAARVRRPVCLLLSANVGSPMTWGVLRPCIVFPADAPEWKDHQLRNALLHEIHHVARFDWLRLWILQLAVAMHWFNPFVWIAARRCRFEAERACDDYVLRSGGESADYAEQLVEIMTKSRRASCEAGLALGNRDFARRVRAILGSTEEVTAMSTMTTRMLPVSVLALAALLAACQLTTAQNVGEPVEVVAESQTAEPFEVIRVEDGQRIGLLEVSDFEEAERFRLEDVREDIEDLRLLEDQELIAEEVRLAQVENEQYLLLRGRTGAEHSPATEAVPPSSEEQSRVLVETQLSLEQQRAALAEQELVLVQYQELLEEHQRALRGQENRMRELRAQYEEIAQAYEAELGRRAREYAEEIRARELEAEQLRRQDAERQAQRAREQSGQQRDVQPARQPDGQPQQHEQQQQQEQAGQLDGTQPPEQF